MRAFKLAVIVCSLGLAVATAAPRAAHANERFGVSETNYLLIAYHFTYPIGALISNGVLRPLLAVGNRINPRPVPGGTRGVGSDCRDLRPTRGCGVHGRKIY